MSSRLDRTGSASSSDGGRRALKRGSHGCPFFVRVNREKRSVAALDEEQHSKQAADGEVADGRGSTGHTRGHVEADDADPHGFCESIHLAKGGEVVSGEVDCLPSNDAKSI